MTRIALSFHRKEKEWAEVFRKNGEAEEGLSRDRNGNRNGRDPDMENKNKKREYCSVKKLVIDKVYTYDTYMTYAYM